jgi:hypothetical protein
LFHFENLNLHYESRFLKKDMEAEGELFGKRKETSVRGLGDKKEK